MTLPNGYETQTTFWSDFTIADAFGDKAIKDTFKRAFKEWKTDKVYVTELAIVMNLKCWFWYDKGNQERSKLYADYYYKVRDWCINHLKGDDLKYYLDITD